MDASLPLDVPISEVTARVEQAAALFSKKQEHVLTVQLRERTTLQKTADLAKRRAWITRAVSMLPPPPPGSSDHAVVQSMLRELADEHWAANARSQIEYELLEPRSLIFTGIDRTALHTPVLVD